MPEINTVLVIAERLDDTHGVRARHEGQTAFITLKKRIQDIFEPNDNYWRVLQKFVDDIETSEQSWQDENFRVHIEQLSRLYGTTGNWVKLLRAPLSYFKIFAE